MPQFCKPPLVNFSFYCCPNFAYCHLILNGCKRLYSIQVFDTIDWKIKFWSQNTLESKDLYNFHLHHTCHNLNMTLEFPQKYQQHSIYYIFPPYQYQKPKYPLLPQCNRSFLQDSLLHPGQWSQCYGLVVPKWIYWHILTHPYPQTTGNYDSILNLHDKRMILKIPTFYGKFVNKLN